jgi:uncharacterized membrane protein
MNQRTRSYLLYLSLGLNLALVAGLFYVGFGRAEIGPNERVRTTVPGEEHNQEESEEWRDFENRMTKVDRKTRPLRRKIARQQRKLLKSLKDPTTDTATIQALHDRIHDYQRKLQNRMLDILMEQRRTLPDPARRRVFTRLLDRHWNRYRTYYDDESSDEHERDDEEEHEEDDGDDD